MRVLITGNMGYVGPILVRHLRKRFPQAHLIGFDSAFFAHCLTDATTLPESEITEQHFGDVREFPIELLQGVDAVVQLAAVSNDPMGNRFEQVTEDINQRSSVTIAEAAQAAGVSHYVFASSCSVYGAGGNSPRTEQDGVNPLTAYARSKIGAERELKGASLGGMTVTCLRFATACGMSPRLRLDLVLNDFVASATASRKIVVLSDGTPWRPLIDVKDMALAIEWAITREASKGGRFLVVNTGSNTWNYQVKELADAVARAVPETEVSINTAAPPDKRSYKVDFSLFTSLAQGFTPRVTLDESIAALREGLNAMHFADDDFRNSQNMRLKVLEAHIEQGRLMQDLHWAVKAG